MEKLEELRFSHTVKPERIALFAWSEALRNEALHREVTIGLGQVRAAIQSLVLRWQQSGLVQPDADPQEIGLAFLAWIPGFFIQHHVAGIVQRDQFVRGVAGLLNPVRDPIA
nr:TetR family transcriptional regulator C-terminal domain-containing protein [Microlunatus panaciterrae]